MMHTRRPSRKRTRPSTAEMRPAASSTGVGVVLRKKMASTSTCVHCVRRAGGRGGRGGGHRVRRTRGRPRRPGPIGATRTAQRAARPHSTHLQQGDGQHRLELLPHHAGVMEDEDSRLAPPPQPVRHHGVSARVQALAQAGLLVCRSRSIGCCCRRVWSGRHCSSAWVRQRRDGGTKPRSAASACRQRPALRLLCGWCWW